MRFRTTLSLLVGALALSAVALPAIAAQDKGHADKPAAREEPKPAQDAKATLGKAAPDFELKDLDGKTVKLSDYKGKIVVLEWFNPGCPVVQRQHDNGVLKDHAATAQKDGVVWLAINSGAAGKEGSDPEANKKARAKWKMEHPVLLDPKGDVGRRYDAKTTPHMYVIDAKGVLVYRGAIDNAASGKPEGDAKLVNYVAAALSDLKAGKPVATAETRAYGCSVKY